MKISTLNDFFKEMYIAWNDTS